jgi:hypothetical protein
MPPICACTSMLPHWSPARVGVRVSVGRQEKQEARSEAGTAKRTLTERLEHAAALGATLVIGGRHPTSGADALGTAAAALLVARDPVEFAEDVADRAQLHLDLLRWSSADLGGALGGHSVEEGQQAEGGEHRRVYVGGARYRLGGWSRAASEGVRDREAKRLYARGPVPRGAPPAAAGPMHAFIMLFSLRLSSAGAESDATHCSDASEP